MSVLIRNILVFLFVQLSLVATPVGLQAQVDPAIEWKEIDTESAYWIFDAKQQEVAHYYIMQFERAKAEVFPLFREEPRKVTIMLLDNTDIANGSARVSPHPVISLFTVQPGPYSSIGEFRDYVHELLVHEYTHILNMEPTHGWMSPLYWIFGSIAHPNMILPRWYTEGLAVYTESKISKDGGRLTSQYTEGLARSLTLEEKWDEFPLSNINDGHPDWLGGSRAYLFGGMLWDQIVRQGGEDMPWAFNMSYSRRVPFFLDGVAEHHIGMDYEEVLKKTYEFWQLGAKKQIDKITKAPHLDGYKVTQDKDGLFQSPKISSDGLWMAYIRHDKTGSGNIYLTLRHPKQGFRAYKPKKVLSGTRSQNLSWHPASTGFVYEKLDQWNFYNKYYDLYFYDLRTKESKRLTNGLRAHSPCFSPLGKTLYFLANSKTSKRIVSMDWLTQKTKVVFKAKIGDDLRFLSCSKKDVLFVIEHKGGEEPHLVRINLKKKSKRKVTSKYPVHFATNTHKGLLIASPKSGVNNLYLLDPKRGYKPKAITNSLTKVIQGELDPLDDSLYYNQATADGPKIYHLKGAQWESFEDTPPKVASIVDYGRPEKKKRKPNQVASNKKKYKTEGFSPWRYLYPNHWIPFLYVVDGGTLYQALTSAGDPLGINSISAVGQWDTLTKKAGGSVSYVNNSTPVSLGLGVGDFYNFQYTTRTNLHFSNASAFVGKRLGFLDNTRFVFRWAYSQLDFGNALFLRQGPQVDFSYRQTKIKPSDISFSSGWKAQLGHRNYLGDLGTEEYGETYAHLGTFWSSFTPGRSVFYLGFNGNYTPNLENFVLFGPSTLAGPFFNPQIANTVYLQRGYPTGVFLSRNAMVNVNAEYRFPIWSTFSGFTSPPVFFKNLQGSLVFDATTLDGGYNDSRFSGAGLFRANMGRWFTGYGLELDSKMNVGFHVPITLTLGLYYGQEEEAFGGFTTFFNVRL